MSKVSGVRKAIYRAIGTVEKGSTNANVVPFPKSKMPRKKVVKKPKRYARITPWDDKFIGVSGKGKSAARDYFTKVEINGKTYMRRGDGAYFKLQRDGSWVLTSIKGGGASPSRGSSFARKALPYAATAAAGGAAAGYIAGRKK